MKTMKHKFVEFIPSNLDDNILYISIEYATATHKCCCGCGNEVVTPITPTDWKLIFDGETISLHPSIGNWNFQCRSHYWIKSNEIKWADEWSDFEISTGRLTDRKNKTKHFKELEHTKIKNTGANINKSKYLSWFKFLK